jgi:hypothetical protein
MQAWRSVPMSGCVQVLSVVLALLTALPSAEGAMITYISSTRYIEGNGILREDAVGFGDFNVSRSVVIGPVTPGATVARVEASQTSRLLADRIEVSATTLTQFLENPLGNSITAISSVDVVFSIEEAKQVTLSVGQILAQSNGGTAGFVLLRSDGTQVLAASSPFDPPVQTAMLNAGVYRFSGGASSGSLQRVAGPGLAVATLTIPPTSAFAIMGVGGMLATASRRRK